MLRLIETPAKPAAALGLTMGGRPPRLARETAPGLTYAQSCVAAVSVSSAEGAKQRRPQLVTIDGIAMSA